MDGEQYDADYFLRGKQTGKSLYENYRWMPELTIPMAAHILCHCDVRKKDNPTILDFGCARGYVVKALRSLGYDAWGFDISKWALENADESVKRYLVDCLVRSYSWIIAKDVLEHVEGLAGVIDALFSAANVGIFAVVPLSHNGKCYDVPEYDQDVTHIHRHPLSWWVGQFNRPGWSVEARYRLPGVKDNYAKYPTGNGFITCRRLSD